MSAPRHVNAWQCHCHHITITIIIPRSLVITPRSLSSSTQSFIIPSFHDHLSSTTRSLSSHTQSLSSHTQSLSSHHDHCHHATITIIMHTITVITHSLAWHLTPWYMHSSSHKTDPCGIGQQLIITHDLIHFNMTPIRPKIIWSHCMRRSRTESENAARQIWQDISDNRQF